MTLCAPWLSSHLSTHWQLILSPSRYCVIIIRFDMRRSIHMWMWRMKWSTKRKRGRGTSPCQKKTLPLSEASSNTSSSSSITISSGRVWCALPTSGASWCAFYVPKDFCVRDIHILRHFNMTSFTGNTQTQSLQWVPIMESLNKMYRCNFIPNPC